jgi:murein DD-endopeptidase MepM/ murein hydrolase activator NlpD
MDTMLSKALREFTTGPLNQLIVNLGGQEGDQWEEELKKFLRKEPCWTNGHVTQATQPKPIPSILELVSTIVVGATSTKLVAKEKFVINTKQQEASYRKLVATKQAERDAFEKELFDFESQLKQQIDPSSIPQTGNKLLNYPLDDVYITQYFGKTVAAKRLYVSGSHNGVDFRASVGTPVKSAASGVVVGTGDTDPACRGTSYGKWVLVKHNNGLTTVYGHLSLIKVTAGQTVGAGQLLAYSGKSGYATGPHLHLSVFPTGTVTISDVPSKVCKGAVMRFPVAPVSAYLDPMAYL